MKKVRLIQDKIRYYCKDCKKEIYRKSERCRRCSSINRTLPKTSRFCKDCGKLLSSKKGIRCNSCAQKARFKTPKNHPSYIDGRSKRKNYCSCGKEISRYSKTNNCASCAKLGAKNSFYGKKHTEESLKKISLSHGGTGIPHEKSGYGREFTRGLKEQIRFRDEYKCRLCGCSQLENGKQLDVHHIDYDKHNNNIDNLISLCILCHRNTNYNRDYWKIVCRECHKRCHSGELKLENVREK